MGFKDVEVDRAHHSPWLKARVHLRYGGQDISTNLCVQYYPQYNFLAPRVSFIRGDWGSVDGHGHRSDGCRGYVGNWEYNNNESRLSLLGLRLLLKMYALIMMCFWKESVLTLIFRSNFSSVKTLIDPFCSKGHHLVKLSA